MEQAAAAAAAESTTGMAAASAKLLADIKNYVERREFTEAIERQIVSAAEVTASLPQVVAAEQAERNLSPDKPRERIPAWLRLLRLVLRCVMGMHRCRRCERLDDEECRGK